MMKTAIRSFLILAFPAALAFSGEELSTVPFVLGPTSLKAGDAIVIQDVWATSTNLTVGDKVVVRGRYDLKSHEKATLALYLTSSGGTGERELPTQTIKIEKGSSEFELSTLVKHVGHLHLSFYGQDSDFGCVYFGTPAQMKQISHWKLSH